MSRKNSTRGRVTIESLENRQLLSGSISGVVYNDVNANGALNSGEPALSGVQVYVDVGNHGSFKAGDPTSTSDSLGEYSMVNVPNGSWPLREVAPKGFRQTQPLNGAPYTVTIANGTKLTNMDFGNTNKVRLSGYVFDDIDNSGTQNNGEPIATGITVYLDANGNHKLDAGETQTTTNSSGYWVIGDLPSGKTYTVRVAPPSGFVQTDPASSGGYTKTLQSGQTADGLMFGIRLQNVVFGSLWRTAGADNGGSVIKTSKSTAAGIFDTTATATDSSGNTGTANLTSSIDATTIRDIGSFSGAKNGQAVTDVDVKFTLSAATKYSTGYDIFGNSFTYTLTNYYTTQTVFSKENTTNASTTNYSNSFSGTLAAGTYELVMNVDYYATGKFKTNSYLMNFILGG